MQEKSKRDCSKHKNGSACDKMLLTFWMLILLTLRVIIMEPL